MGSWINIIIIVIVFMNLIMAVSSRIATCIRTVAVQGALIAFLPLMISGSSIAADRLVFSIMSVILKGFLFPWLLFRAQREADVRREIEPIGGSYSFSLIICLVLFLVSCWLSSRLPYIRPVSFEWIVPVSLATFFTGAFIIVSRTKALTQVLGYLVLENGIYLFGMALLVEQSLLVELAILLDIFVAVFVMGIAIFHISREFDHINTHQLSELKDWVDSKEGQAG